MIPHALLGPPRPTLSLLQAVPLEPLGSTAVVVLGSRGTRALVSRSLAALIAAVESTGLAARAVDEHRVASRTAAHDQDMARQMPATRHSCFERTNPRRRRKLGPQSARDKATPLAGRSGGNPGRPSRLLSMTSFTPGRRPRKFSAASPQQSTSCESPPRAPPHPQHSPQPRRNEAPSLRWGLRLRRRRPTRGGGPLVPGDTGGNGPARDRW